MFRSMLTCPVWFDDFFRGMDELHSLSSDVKQFDVDVQNVGDDIVVRADVPGISKDDLNITVENGVLTISGERKREPKKKENSYYLCERFHGSYSRSFQVPPDIDDKSINATLSNGVLQLVLRRSPEAKTRKIKID